MLIPPSAADFQLLFCAIGGGTDPQGQHLGGILGCSGMREFGELHFTDGNLCISSYFLEGSEPQYLQVQFSDHNVDIVRTKPYAY